MDLRNPLLSALTRRRFVTAAGIGGTTLVTGLARGAAGRARAQEAPVGELVIGVTQDDYRIDPPERANIGYYPLKTDIFESLVRLTPDYQI